MTPRTVRHVLASVLVVAAVVGVLAGATSALVGHRDDGATRGAATTSTSLSLAPGDEQVVAWTGSKRQAGLSFRAPASAAAVTVGLQVRATRTGSGGYRTSLTLSAAGTATAVIARVRHSRVRTLRTATLPGRWSAGDVVRLQTRVASRAGRFTVRLRALADGSAPSGWITGVDHRTRPGWGGQAVLAFGELDAAATASVSIEIGTYATTYAPTATPTPTLSTNPSPTTSVPPQVPSDAFGPIGEPMSGEDQALLGWDGIQAADPERVTVLRDGSQLGADQPAGPIWRAQAVAGELYTDGRSRSEAYGRRATPWSAPASQWPDPPGAERWFTFSVFVPAAFPVATDTTWLDLTQWKGYRGGSPPIALEMKRSRWRLGGSRANDGLIAQDDIGPIVFGAWTRFTVGLHYSTSADDGWVQVFRNGKEVLARTAVATMDTYEGQPDPVYLKQGIYRSTAWKVDQALYFSPVLSGTTMPLTP